MPTSPPCAAQMSSNTDKAYFSPRAASGTSVPLRHEGHEGTRRKTEMDAGRMWRVELGVQRMRKYTAAFLRSKDSILYRASREHLSRLRGEGGLGILIFLIASL